MSLDLYKNGIISKCECERLMSFSNNASPAYVIFAVGATLKCSIKDGIALYLIMLSSSILTGIFIGINKEKSKNMSFFIEQKYSFTDSVKSAAQICINVCSFITTFAVICNLIRKFVASELICALVFSLVEIGNCSAYLSESCNLPPVCNFVLSAFSISFSGACVIAQVASIGVPCARPSIIKHVTYKLVQGVISVILSFVVFTFLR